MVNPNFPHRATDMQLPKLVIDCEFKNCNHACKIISKLNPLKKKKKKLRNKINHSDSTCSAVLIK